MTLIHVTDNLGNKVQEEEDKITDLMIVLGTDLQK